MNHSDALDFLTRDSGRVPCSRYGWDSESCAPVAIRFAEIVADATGEHVDEDSLDHAMSLVVNDHDDVASIIREHGSLLDSADFLPESEWGPTWRRVLVTAAEMGREAGRSAGTWVEVPSAEWAESWADDVDPEVLDSINWPNLSGEWADDPTPQSLAADIGIRSDSRMLDRVCDVWEESAHAAFQAEIDAAVMTYGVEGGAR